MSLDRAAREKLVWALAESVIQHADELTSLDQAISRGYLLPADRQALLAQAQQVQFPSATS